MNPNAANEYLRAKVLTATPEQLQLMLYDGAVRFTEKGRQALLAKNYDQSFHNITKAQKILLELNCSLKHDLAPELLFTSEFTAANYKALVAKLLGHAPSDALLAAYPGRTDAEAKASINRLTNDWWGWRMWYWTRLQAQHGKAKPYLFYFTHMPAQPNPCHYACGVGHGAEILYAFDNLQVEQRDWTAEDRQLARDLADTWVRFARDGAPGNAWRAFDGSDASVHRIATGSDDPGLQILPDFSLFSPPAGAK